MLKERTVAIEVFGRSPQSDLGEDTIVRVGAREVRKRLAQYYVTAEGSASEVVIDLPPGSYAPEFRYAGANKAREEPPPVVAPAESGRWWMAAGVVVLLVALGAIAATRWTGSNPGLEAFRRFWEPVFLTSEPMLLAVGHPIVYHPSSRAMKMSEERLPPLAVPMQRPIQLPPKELDGSDIVPVLNQYVGFGDMVAGTEVAAMLARRSKGVQVRLASSVQFADLRQAQTLLIGAFTNRWTMELEQGWRFQFARTSERMAAIVDTMGTAPPGTPRLWRIPAPDDGSALEDYILVCRMRNSVAGGILFVAAGLKQFGTEAAGRLLTDPARLGVILRKLPAGWESKNLQIVLHARVIGNTPAQPELVASHVW